MIKDVLTVAPVTMLTLLSAIAEPFAPSIVIMTVRRRYQRSRNRIRYKRLQPGYTFAFRGNTPGNGLMMSGRLGRHVRWRMTPLVMAVVRDGTNIPVTIAGLAGQGVRGSMAGNSWVSGSCFFRAPAAAFR